MTQDELTTILAGVIAEAHDEIRISHAAVIAKAVVEYLSEHPDCITAVVEVCGDARPVGG